MRQSRRHVGFDERKANGLSGQNRRADYNVSRTQRRHVELRAIERFDAVGSEQQRFGAVAPASIGVERYQSQSERYGHRERDADAAEAYGAETVAGDRGALCRGGAATCVDGCASVDVVTERHQYSQW